MKPSVRNAVVIAAISAAVLLIVSLPAGAAASDKDCADFPTQRAAQIFFLKHGGPRYDPDRLDADDDGIACEDNPCPCSSRKHLSTRDSTAALPADRSRATEPTR